MKDQTLDEVFTSDLMREDKPKAARKPKILPSLANDMSKPIRILPGKCNRLVNF